MQRLHGSLLLGAAGLLRGYRAAVHWGAREALNQFGAEPSSERVCVDRNRITGGGVTAGVDFGIKMAGQWAGESMGRVIELIMEYAPQPPYGTGRPDLADAQTLAAARGDATGDDRCIRIEQRIDVTQCGQSILTRRTCTGSNHHAPINLDSTCSPNKALQVTIFPLLRNGKTAAEPCVNRVIELNSPSNKSCEICLKRSVQSQADSGLPTQLIPVAFRRVNHTFLYLYPRDT